ncbi:MAG: hypothetical protein VKJ44_03045 [Synechococcus sp.]|nr:hypothetical protein [Synechococcus sp.]
MQTPAPGLAYLTSAPHRPIGFLEESPGNSSAMRLMCMMALVTAIILSVFVIATPPRPYAIKDAAGRVISVNHPPRDSLAIYLIFGFLVAAFAPKAIQKFAEKLPTYDPKLNLAQVAGATPAMLSPVAMHAAPPMASLAAPVQTPIQMQSVQPGVNPADPLAGLVPLAAADQRLAPGIIRLQGLRNRGDL